MRILTTPCYSQQPIYIIPSEALDLDSLASSMLFAELWSKLEWATTPVAGYFLPPTYSQVLLSLHRQYSERALHCFLPLSEWNELLWRKDIRYLLHFLGQRYQSGDEINTLYYLWENFKNQSLEFGLDCPSNTTEKASETAAFILIDRHHLPFHWPQTLQVLAIWDHRPDNGALLQIALRCIQPATSCTALLLDCAAQLGLLSGFSEGALIFAMSALYLDGYGSELLFWELPIWQHLCARLERRLSALEQIELQNRIVQERDNPDGDIFQQTNTDVKIANFQREKNGTQIRIAVSVVPLCLSVMQELYEKGSLAEFVSRCLEHQEADFLIVLHRESIQNSQRGISFFFCAGFADIFWTPKKINFFLLQLQRLFPSRSIFCCSQTEITTQFWPQLLQWQQEDPSLGRKAFMPALRKSFERLLVLDKIEE